LRRRILFVAEPHSVHTQGWLRLLEATGWDVHVLAPGGPPACRLPATFHTLDPNVANPAGNGVRPFWPFRRGLTRAYRMRFGSGPDGESRRLAELVRKLKPAIVHSMRLQTEGYTTLGALEAIRQVGAAWVVSLWGSDLAYYAEQPGHRGRVRAVLAHCDRLLADCRRDLRLARRYGADERALADGEPVPGNGGVDVERICRRVAEADPARRRIVLFPHAREDRFHQFGPVVAALRASGPPEGYQFVFLGCDEAARQTIQMLPSGLRCRCRALPTVPPDEALEWIARSRAVVKPSRSDGTPNAMLEAMAAGALPVVSPIESIREWVEAGVNGLLVSNGDASALAAAIARACTDDDLVRTAAAKNLALVRERADRRAVRGRVLAMYERLATESRGPEY